MSTKATVSGCRLRMATATSRSPPATIARRFNMPVSSSCVARWFLASTRRSKYSSNRPVAYRKMPPNGTRYRMMMPTGAWVIGRKLGSCRTAATIRATLFTISSVMAPSVRMLPKLCRAGMPINRTRQLKTSSNSSVLDSSRMRLYVDGCVSPSRKNSTQKTAPISQANRLLGILKNTCNPHSCRIAPKTRQPLPSVWTIGGARLPTTTRSEERRVGKECRSRCDWSSDVCSSDLLEEHLQSPQLQDRSEDEATVAKRLDDRRRAVADDDQQHADDGEDGGRRQVLRAALRPRREMRADHDQRDAQLGDHEREGGRQCIHR